MAHIDGAGDGFTEELLCASEASVKERASEASAMRELALEAGGARVMGG